MEGCPDSFEEDSNKKQEWKLRKTSYIKRPLKEPQSTLLVSVADKLSNARAIVLEFSVSSRLTLDCDITVPENLFSLSKLTPLTDRAC